MTPLLASYRTAAKRAEGRFEEKKSVFIGTVAPCAAFEEAEELIRSVRGTYPDANHHVWAFVNREGNVIRFDDDGEPKGTGGVPALEVLKKEGITGVCVVITRYFGGILLGAGGLARAYARGVRTALEASGVAEFRLSRRLSFSVSYGAWPKTENELARRAIPVLKKEFGERVLVEVLCGEEAAAQLDAFLLDLTAGAEKTAFLGWEYAE